MTAIFSATEFAAFTGGRWLNDLEPAESLSVSTDTRIDNNGKIFFALQGEKFDAHDFLEQAVASQCGALCVNEDQINKLPEADIPVLLVRNTLTAMQNCAACHRKKFNDLTVFAVTGSVGKTSVKEMLKAICSYHAGEHAVLATSGNTNNQIGVAQNLFKLNDTHRYAILEAGTNSPGEILPLAKMIMPHGAIVNSIAPCHLEKLIDLNGVAREKSAVFSQLADKTGIALFPFVTEGKKILESAACGKISKTFGVNGNGDVHARFIAGELSGSSFELNFPDGKSYVISWGLTGEHNALNAAGAAALAFYSGIPSQVIAKALPMTILPGMRMKKVSHNGVLYFNDAYNANPASMHASVNLLASSGLKGRLFLVLGSMLELGGISRDAHQKLLREAAKKLPDAICITIGQEFEGLSENHFEKSEDAGIFLASQLRQGDIVFAKGSRSIAVEKALPEEVR